MKDALSRCWNGRTLPWVALATGVILVFGPRSLVAAALPVLLLAACPVFMVLMARVMRGGSPGHSTMACCPAETDRVERLPEPEPMQDETTPGPMRSPDRGARPLEIEG